MRKKKTYVYGLFIVGCACMFFWLFFVDIKQAIGQGCVNLVCGQTITSNTLMCPGNTLNCTGITILTIGANNITLDGNGNTITSGSTSIYANNRNNITIKNISLEDGYYNISLSNISGLYLDNISISGGLNGIKIIAATGVNFDANADGSTTKITLKNIRGNQLNEYLGGGAAGLYMDNVNGTASIPLIINPTNFTFLNNGSNIGIKNANYVTIKDFVGPYALVGGTMMTDNSIGYGNTKIGIDLSTDYNFSSSKNNIIIQNMEFRNLDRAIDVYRNTCIHNNLIISDIISDTTINLYGVTSGIFKNIFINGQSNSYGITIYDSTGLLFDNITISGGVNGMRIINNSGINFDANTDGSTTKITLRNTRGGVYNEYAHNRAALYLHNIYGNSNNPLIIDPTNFTFQNNGVNISFKDMNYITIKDFVGPYALVGGTTTEVDLNSKIGIEINADYNTISSKQNIVIQNMEISGFSQGIGNSRESTITGFIISGNTIINNNYGISLAGMITGFQVTHNNIYNNTTRNFYIYNSPAHNFSTGTQEGNFWGHTLLTGPCFYPSSGTDARSPDDTNFTGITDSNCFYNKNAWNALRRSYGLIPLLISVGGLENIPWITNGLGNKFNAAPTINTLPIIVGQVYFMTVGFTNNLGRTTSNDKMDTDFHFKVPLPDNVGIGNTGKVEMKIKFFTSP